MSKKIYEKQYTIKMHDTDATGFIYFNQVFRLACDAFEEALEHKGIIVHEIVAKHDLAFPIVASSSQYFAPLGLSQRVKIELYLKRIREKSFCLHSSFIKVDCETLASEVEITHACISSKTRVSCSVPDQLINFFK